MTFTSLALGVVAGLALASICLLIAISFTLIISVSGVFNFAQGTVAMGGAILSYVLGVLLHWPVLAVVAAITLTGGAAGLLTHLLAVRPLKNVAHEQTRSMTLSTIGVATAANATIAILFGANTLPVPSYMPDAPVFFFGVPLRPIYLVCVSAGASVAILLEVILRNTQAGSVFRATLEDPDGAKLQGIDTGRVILAAFAAAGALSALAGFLVAPITSASAFSATELAFYGFAAMAIGGFGSFAGALAGATLVGLILGLTPVLLDPKYTMPLLWATVFMILLVRPAGLLGVGGLFGSAKLRDV
jgi:branched-chain amino acid transport system permease protein